MAVSVVHSSNVSNPDSTSIKSETYSLGRNILKWIENHLPYIFRLIACIFSIKSEVSDSGLSKSFSAGGQETGLKPAIEEAQQNEAFQCFQQRFEAFQPQKDCKISKFESLKTLESSVSQVIRDLGRQSIEESAKLLTPEEEEEFKKILKDKFGLTEEQIKQMQSDLTKMGLVEIKKVGEFYGWDKEKMNKVLNYFHQGSAAAFPQPYNQLSVFQEFFILPLRENKSVYGDEASAESQIYLNANVNESSLGMQLSSVHEIFINNQTFGVTLRIFIAFDENGEILLEASKGAFEKLVSGTPAKTLVYDIE